MNKGGQLFIVAALIIAGALYGLTSSVNAVQVSKPDTAFYDLSKEINFESKRVIDFGVYNQQDNKELVRQFLVEYSDYIAQEQAIFVFGNEGNLWGLTFTGSYSGGIGVSAGTVPNSFSIQQTVNQDAIAEIDNSNSPNILVKIDDITYPFQLKKGENFFLVIIKGGPNEAYVATRD